MYSEAKKQMVDISSYAGRRKDYVQGGGGNTSVKFDERLMGIKASGYTLEEVTQDRGYVTVDYGQIRTYYNNVDVNVQKDYESESLGVNLESVVLLEDMENKRPSVEVGFHSFLKKCVIHTHSVYANILCCALEGEKIAQEILGGDVGFIFIPYIDPGFRLTLAIKQATAEFMAKHGVLPEAIFMKNHGLIVHSDESDAAIALHEKINNLIKAHFDLDDFPVIAIAEQQEGYQSKTDFMHKFILEFSADEAYFDALKLYPDQLVYIGDKMGNQIRINNGQIIYSTGQKEAQTIEETLVAIAYIVDAIKKSGLTLAQMGEKDISFINSWESEKYRSSLVGKES